MDTSPKTCCYRPLTSSPLLAELMVVMGGVTTAELVRGNLAYVCTLYTIRDVSVMSIPVSPKHFLSLKSFLSDCFFTTFDRLFRRSFLL